MQLICANKGNFFYKGRLEDIIAVKGNGRSKMKIVNCGTWGVIQLTMGEYSTPLVNKVVGHSSAVAAPLYAIYRHTRYTTTSTNTNICGGFNVNLCQYTYKIFSIVTLFIKTCG